MSEQDQQHPAASPAQTPVMISPEMLEPVKPPELRVDFERGMSYAPWLTLALILINISAFIWELAAGALESVESIVRAGALVRDKLLEGEYWRLFTPMFLHGGFDHLIGNCIALYVLGMACEHAFGIGPTALIYFLSGIGGFALSAAMSPGPSVGASGAIFGLSGAVIVFLYKHHKLFYLRDKRVGFVLLFWALYTVATGFLDSGIDNFAHIGGFIVGAVLGAFLPMRKRADLQPAFAVLRR